MKNMSKRDRQGVGGGERKRKLSMTRTYAVCYTRRKTTGIGGSVKIYFYFLSIIHGGPPCLGLPDHRGDVDPLQGPAADHLLGKVNNVNFLAIC
jgi:hypothetical protein